MAFLDTLEETLNAGDPLVREWPLISTYWYPLGSTLLYIFIVKRLGPAFMENRKPFDLRIPMIVYNFSIVFVYTCSLLTLIYYGLTTDAYKRLCDYSKIEDTNHYTYKCSVAGWYIYMLKYVEYADTIFFILRKKNHLITNLHVIHHATLPILGWLIARTERSGFQFLPGGLNAFIHIIMYTYYGLAAMGPEVQKKLWWKEYLTLLQMAQFVIILLFVFIVVPISGCKTSSHGIFFDIFFAALFLALFYNFYKKTYKKKGSEATHQLSNGYSNVHKED